MTRTLSCKNLCSANSPEGQPLIPALGSVSMFMMRNHCLCVSSCTFFISAVSSVPWGEYRIKQWIFIIGRVQREGVITIRFSVCFFQSSEVVCECKSDLTSRVVTR